MTSQTAASTPYQVSPYLTPAEYQNAPTALDTTNLVTGGSAAAQTAELRNVILRASGYVNVICGQMLQATVDTEVFRRLRPDRDGIINLHPKQWPVLEVQALRYGPTPAAASWSTLTDLTGLLVDAQIISWAYGSGATSFSSVGPLDLSGYRGGYAARLWGQFTYVNGWPNTTLTSSPSAGATTFTVAAAAGIYTGTTLTIYDGAATESVTVTNVTGTTLTVAPLASAHTAGVSVSALPPEVKEAAILLTSGLIKTRGSAAYVMANHAGNAGGGFQAIDGISYSDMAIAREMLQPFRRRR